MPDLHLPSGVYYFDRKPAPPGRPGTRRTGPSSSTRGPTMPWSGVVASDALDSTSAPRTSPT